MLQLNVKGGADAAIECKSGAYTAIECKSGMHRATVCQPLIRDTVFTVGTVSMLVSYVRRSGPGAHPTTCRAVY